MTLPIYVMPVNSTDTDLQAAVTQIASDGGGIILIPSPGPHDFLNSVASLPDFTTIASWGAQMKDDKLSIPQGGDYVNILGGHHIATDDMANLDSSISFAGKGTLALGTRIQGRWNTGFNIKRTAVRTLIVAGQVDATLWPGETIPDEAFEVAVLSGEQAVAVGLLSFDTGDDGVVVKALTENSARGIVASAVSINRSANVYAVGTQALPAVQGVVMTSGAGIEVGAGAQLKISTQDSGAGYPNGLVEGLIFSNIVVTAPLGEKFSRLLDIQAARGGKIRDCIIDNIVGNVRGKGGQAHAGIYVIASNTEVPTPGETTTIERVTFSNIRCKDVLNGVDNNGTTVLTFAMDYGIYCEETQHVATSTWGIIRDVSFRNIVIDGCTSHGVFHNCPTGNEILYDGLEIRNWGTTMGSARGFRLTAGKVRARNWRIEPRPSGGREIEISDGATLLADVATIPLGTIAAGGTGQARWAVPGRCYVYDAFIISRTAIPQNDTNFLTFTVEKFSGGTNLSFITNTTKATGGINVTANQKVRINTVYPTSVNAYCAAGEFISFRAVPSGTGQAYTDAVLVLHYVTY